MWFKRKIEDTQPLPKVSQNVLEAYDALDQVTKNKRAAEKRAIQVQRRADELIDRCNDNHFAQAWLAILRQE